MQRTTRQPGRPPAGFTLIEILVVISVLVAIIAISVAVYANMMETARRAATMATISKVDKLLQQQVSAWSKEFRDSEEVERTSQHPQITGLVNGEHARRALALKFYYRLHFPQNAAEAGGFDATPGTRDDTAAFRDWLKPPAMGGNVASAADSSELLYLALTQGRVRSIAAVDADSFAGRELADTDGDGFNELVDGWGNPLRFYRWPTRLLNPFGFVAATLSSPVTTTDQMLLQIGDPIGQFTFDDVFGFVQSADSNANIFVVVGREIIEVIPSGNNLQVVKRGAQSTNPEAHPTGSLVKLAASPETISMLFGSLNSSAVAHDPDDPRGEILTNVLSAPDPKTAAANCEALFHTLDSFHTPLIVSAGSDGILGLFEPDNTMKFGHFAAPDTTGGYSIVVDPLNSTLNDNLTNQMQGLGN